MWGTVYLSKKWWFASSSVLTASHGTMKRVFQPTGTLDDIVPGARWAFEELIGYAEELGLEPRVVSAGRTCAQQDALAARGAHVTGASGCSSWHVFGRAVDLSIDPPTCEAYRRLGAFWERLGGFWGGRWTQFGPCGDAGHFHLPDARATAEGSPAYCPPDPSSCEAFRREYLEKQFAPRGRALWAVATGATVAGAVVWWRRRR